MIALRRPGDGDEAATHAELVREARRLELLALDGDVEALHAALCQLRNHLVAHLAGEATAFDATSPSARRVVRAGQRRLVDEIDHLLEGGDGRDGCRCVPRSSRLARSVAAQARLEARLLTDRHARRPDRP